MRPKILITGKNVRIIENIMDHFEADHGYRVEKCVANKYDLQDKVREMKPNIAIICTADESAEEVEIYDAFRELNYYSGIPVIVVASKEDAGVFKNNTKLLEVYYLPRPLSILAVYNKLSELEQYILPDDSDNEEDEDDDDEEFNFFRRKDNYEDESFDDEPKIKKKRILVVDDEAEQLAVLKGFLREFYDVTAVRTGEAALDYIENYNVDLMVLDFMMPNMSGPEVLYRIRTKRALANLPVIFLTGMSDRETVVKTLTELRPQGYVLKPVKKSDLIARIIDVIG